MTELEVEDVEVCPAMPVVGRLGNGAHVVLLDEPSQRHLGGGLIVSLADPTKILAFRDSPLGQRAVRCDQIVIFTSLGQKLVLLLEGMVHDLVAEDGRVLAGLIDETGREVAHAKVSDLSRVLKLSQRCKCLF